MNKDVIYIEPEDDITSIIRKMNNSKNKLVALVPPKRIGVLRSAVNTRLIAKNAKQSGKTVVIVSTDSSLTKLSAAAGIPVADTLQSRPKLPDQVLGTPAKDAIPSEITIEEDKTMTISSDDKPAEEAEEEASNEPKEEVEEEPAKKGPRLAKEKVVDDEINSIELEEEAEKSGEEKPGKKKKLIPDMDRYKKWIIGGSIAGVLLIAFVVWAVVFAPFVKINVAIRTTGNNFSENVTFVTKAENEKAEEGVFYIEKQTYEATNSVDFTATGEKEVGEKATGKLSLTATFSTATAEEHIKIPSGSTFTYGEYEFVSTSNFDVWLDTSNEEDNCTLAELKSNTCTVSDTITVEAKAPGTSYNLQPATSGWKTPAANVSAKNETAFTGGTSKTVKIVQQSDIDTAKTKLQSSSEETNKAKLLAQFSSDTYKIEGSYKVEPKDPVSSAKVGEEVKEGTTAKLTQATTYSMLGVDTNKLSAFVKIKTTASIASDQKIYETGSPFLENFRETDGGGYAARLKTTTQTGPSVTEEEILEKSKGKKIGEVQSLLKSINGVSSVKIDKSFFWVNSVPGDANKIEIELKVEE